MYALEKAVINDAEVCFKILDFGRSFQREQGFVQWTDDFPNLDTVKTDILNQKGYKLLYNGEIIGYMYIAFDGEKEYDNIEGKWSFDGEYATVHRVAFKPEFRGKGLSKITFDLIIELCKSKNFKSIRMDTDEKNLRMQHVLEKNGFKRCGRITYNEGFLYVYENVLEP